MLLSIIKDWVSFGADICIFIITIYTFYLTFLAKKIRCVSFGMELSAFEGTKLSVVLENRCLASIAIESVDLLIDDKYIINLKRYNKNPITIEPLKTYKVTTDAITDSVNPDEYMLKIISGKSFEAIVRLYTGETIETSKNNFFRRIFIYLKRKLNLIKDKSQNKKREEIKLVRKQIDGIFISNFIKYMLTINNRKRRKIILVLDTGKCSKSYNNLKNIPSDIVKDYNKTKEYIQSLLNNDEKFELIELKKNKEDK